MPKREKSLSGKRVQSALNGLELFGHERGNLEVFKVLRDLGAEVMVGVNAQEDNHVKVELNRLGFETFMLPFGPQWSIQWVKKKPSIALTNLLSVLRCSLVFYRAIRKFRATHVFLGSPLSYSYLFLALALCRIPVVYRMGDCPPIDSPFNLKIWRMAVRRSVCIVAISEFVRNLAIGAGAEAMRISVIYSLAPSSNDSSSGNDYLGKNGADRNNLVYLGAVSEHKGLLQLADAFAPVARKYPSLVLDILGGSRYDTAFRKELAQKVAQLGLQDRVLFHGHVDDPSNYLRCSIIHIAPSVWEEALGNVVLEAKREGTPSIIFPSGGLPEMVRHEIDGYICREKSVNALLDALEWMLSDPVRLEKMGTAACEDSEQRFGKERFYCDWANVYLDKA